jgi:hypothetical protein
VPQLRPLSRIKIGQPVAHVLLLFFIPCKTQCKIQMVTALLRIATEPKDLTKIEVEAVRSTGCMRKKSSLLESFFLPTGSHKRKSVLQPKVCIVRIASYNAAELLYRGLPSAGVTLAHGFHQFRRSQVNVHPFVSQILTLSQQTLSLLSPPVVRARVSCL